MDELDHQKIIKKIIYKELEPSVLNEQIITKAIYEQGPEGEAGRLFRASEIQYEKVTVLRLEFMNILKIDHVWILPNLQILSLAFNKIDKIENLEALTRLKELNLTYNSIEKLENLNLKSLEILSVFGNKIRMIENVDCLENLIIFSAGNNLIDTKNGIERLRFVKTLRSLNMKGNQVEKNDKYFRIFIAGLLPHLSYYENKYISKEERDEGKDRFRFKLREIMDFEKFEVQEREQNAKDREENLHFTKCFIEHLDKHQLLDSLFIFDSDDQGECLLNIGGEEKNLIAEFRDQSFIVTQKIFKIGLEQYEKRTAEEKIFMNCVTVGRKKIQIDGQNTINEFMDKRDKLLEELKQIVDLEEISEDDLNERFSEAAETFNQWHDESWKSLMENEMHLHESVNDSNTIFEHVIQDMMNEFIEQCKSQFVQLREIESNFVDAMTEAVQSFITALASSGREEEIPDELKETLVDRDVICNLAGGMREMHMLKIDGREDLLIGRGKKWVQELCDQMAVAEVERNRRKVMEINYFLDNQQIIFDDVTTEIRANVNIKTIKINESPLTEEQGIEKTTNDETDEVVETVDPEVEDYQVPVEV